MSILDMSQFLKLEKYSFGVGDRFARQGQAQLRAFIQAAEQGVEIIPVWNKSNREHLIIGSEPASTRAAAVAAVEALGWPKPFHVDADHVRLETVDRYLPHSDFYTLDVAQTIGSPATPKALAAFVGRHSELVGSLVIPGIEHPFQTTHAGLERMARKYLLAVREAARLYRHILEAKGPGTFVTEVSMDETDSPQTPPELLVILAALADEAVPLQTIAPKFTGRFNKGVDYLGDLARFEEQFCEDLAVLAFAVNRYGLPPTLKLSVHSGSDKFSIYRGIRRGLARFKGRPPSQNRRNHVAGRGHRAGSGRRQRPGAGQRALRRGPRPPRGALRALRDRDQHGRQQAPFLGRGERLERAAVCRRVAP